MKLPVAEGTPNRRFTRLIRLTMLLAALKVGGMAMASETESNLQLLTWNLQNTLVAYEAVGRTNSNWDEPAKLALNSYARTRAGANIGVEQQIIASNSETAIQAGCDDPLIAYLYTRYGLIQKDLKPKVFGAGDDCLGNGLAASFCKAADALNQSQYPYIRKFYGSLWAAIYLNRSNVSAHDAETSFEASRFEKLAVTNLVMAINEKTMPAEEIYDSCQLLFDNFKADQTDFETVYVPIESAIFNNHDRSVGLLVRGIFCIDSAWESRGGDYADKVTVSGWRYFRLRLNVAEQSLEEAWKLNPTEPLIPTRMITVEMGQGKGRDVMEMWFERAMALDSNNAEACKAKMLYLEPRWYGTNDEAIVFGRECLNSKKWGGKVPLVVPYEYSSIGRQVEQFYREDFMAHASSGFNEVTPLPPLPDELKNNFAWQEVDAAYRKYLQNNPDDLIERQKYICSAADANRWDIVNAQLPLIGNVHSVEIFGRDYLYNQMVQAAKDALNPNPKPKISPPRIIAIPIKRPNNYFSSVVIGTPVMLSVITESDYNSMLYPTVDKRLIQIHFQWRLNGANIVNATNPVYIIHAAMPKDSGEYTVVATNGGGSTIGTNGVLSVH